MQKQKNLTEAAREARLEYYRQYRKNNKEKIREQNRRYWERRAAKQEASDGNTGTTN